MAETPLTGQTERVLDALTEALTGREGTRRVIERALPDQGIFDGYQTACLLADEVWPLLQAHAALVAQEQRDADADALDSRARQIEYRYGFVVQEDADFLRSRPLITEEAIPRCNGECDIYPEPPDFDRKCPLHGGERR